MKTLKKLITISLFNLFIIIGVISAGSTVVRGDFGVAPAPLIVSASPASQPQSQPLKASLSPKPVVPEAAAPSPRPQPAATVTPKPSPPPPAVSDQCVIMIDGAKYNVTQFRRQHSGGDIFKCNTDMSQIFWSRHNQAILQKMQQFRI